jgi:hypothetical protein
MPGLVCVLGRDRAADLARAAARPLLRRPWQTLELAPTRDDVALGFAGECGGIVHDPETGVALAFDGETFGEGGALAGAQAVQELLAGYLAAGADVKLPQGAFAAAVWDPRSESLTLLTDNHGRRNFWMAELGGTWLFAGELKALVAAGVEPRLDLETWSQVFAYESPLPGQCPLEGVSLLGGATPVTIAGGRKEARTRWRYRLAPETEGTSRSGPRTSPRCSMRPWRGAWAMSALLSAAATTLVASGRSCACARRRPLRSPTARRAPTTCVWARRSPASSASRTVPRHSSGAT